MVVDVDGAFLTQREHPRLAQVEPASEGETLRLTAPDMPPLDLALRTRGPSRPVTVWHSRVRGHDEGDAAAAWFTRFLRADVRIVRFDRAAKRCCNPDYAGDSGAHTLFSDGYPILVIGSASLEDLNGRLAAKGEAALPMNRFRPNVVVAGLAPYDEDHLDTIDCDGVALRLVKPCTRCQVTTTDQHSARVGLEPLRTLSTYRRNDRLAAVVFGMNALVAAGAGRTLATGAAATVAYRF